MKKLKKFFATLQIIALVSLISAAPVYAGEKPAFGEETPFIFCTFEKEGETADGNALTAGDYTVRVILSAMEQNSVFQFTANYNFDKKAISSLDIVSTNENMACGGIKKTDNALVVVLASEEESGNSLNGEDTAYAEMHVTIDIDENETIDFRDCFRFDKNPDLTFVESAYEEGIENAYVLNTSTDTQYKTSRMIADESPSLNGNYYTVEGQITVSLNETGTLDTGLGKAGISVSVVSQTDNYEKTVLTAENGEYSLPDIPEGEYIMNISGPTTIDRDVNLSVNSQKAELGVIQNAPVSVVTSDYNNDGRVTTTDLGLLYVALNDSSIKNADFYDISCDNKVTTTDIGLIYILAGKVVNYKDLTL